MQPQRDTSQQLYKQSVIRSLNVLREYYHRRFGELAVGKLMSQDFEEAMQIGGSFVDIHYSLNGVFREEVDTNIFERLGWAPIDHNKKMFELLEEQGNAEYQLRSKEVRQYIKNVGLEGSVEEIIDGMNKTVKRVTMWPDTSAIESGNAFRCWQVLQCDNAAMLAFALDYVDRWKKYNKLFGDL